MDKDILLIFDLADRPGRIGILENERPIIWHPLADGLANRKIVQAVHAFLGERKMTLNQMNAFASVTKGSSFTGMRIGASVANAFAWVFGRPAVGVHSSSARLIQAAYKRATPNATIEITYPSDVIPKANPG
mgnify:CR=1 FL=1